MGRRKKSEHWTAGCAGANDSNDVKVGGSLSPLCAGVVGVLLEGVRSHAPDARQVPGCWHSVPADECGLLRFSVASSLAHAAAYVRQCWRQWSFGCLCVLHVMPRGRDVRGSTSDLAWRDERHDRDDRQSGRDPAECCRCGPLQEEKNCRKTAASLATQQCAQCGCRDCSH